MISKQMQKLKEITKIPKITPGTQVPIEIEDKLQKLKEIQNVIDHTLDTINEIMQDKKLIEISNIIADAEEKRIARLEKLGITKHESIFNEATRIKQIETEELGKQIENHLWGPDQFTKGKKDAIADSTGEIRLLRSKKSTRKIKLGGMFKLFPLHVQTLIEDGKINVTIKDAETVLNKKEINEVCDTTTTYSYELYIRDGRNIPTEKTKNDTN